MRQDNGTLNYESRTNERIYIYIKDQQRNICLVTSRFKILQFGGFFKSSISLYIERKVDIHRHFPWK
jgi:hypothetical protein